MRKNRTSLIAAMSVFAAALLTGNAAFANSYIHQTTTEKGYVTYPEHFKSERTRAEVQAEAAAFVKQGGSDAFRGVPWWQLPAARYQCCLRQDP